MKNLTDALNVLGTLKNFFETNKIPTLIYLVVISLCVILILHMDLSWAYYLLAVTFPALFTKVSMYIIDFLKPYFGSTMKRKRINRKLNRLIGYEKEILRGFIDKDDTHLKIDMSYRCEGLINQGVLSIVKVFSDDGKDLYDQLNSDQVIVLIDRKAFLRIKNKPDLIN